MKFLGIILFLLLSVQSLRAQRGDEIQWTADGSAYTLLQNGQLIRMEPTSGNQQVLVKKDELKANGEVLEIENYSFSQNGSWLLIFTNTARVWRYNTRGDYWLFNLKDRTLHQLGKTRPSQSLMFAKISPDGTKVAYVSLKNIYVEDIKTGTTKALTVNGKDKMINGTFDWVYEEEFFAGMVSAGPLTAGRLPTGRLMQMEQGIII